MKKEFKYKLSEPIKVAVDGKEVESADVVVYAPRPKYKIEIMKLESIIGPAVQEILFNLNKMIDSVSNSDAIESKKDVKNNVDLYEKFVIPKIDMDKMQSLEIVFNNILCGGNSESPMATIGGAKFTKPLCDEISAHDYKSMIARYCDHFLSLI